MAAVVQRALAFVTTLACVTWTWHAHAATDGTFRIDWPALPGCPKDTSVLADGKRAVVGASHVDRVLARAEITPPPDGDGAWILHIRTRTVRAQDSARSRPQPATS